MVRILYPLLALVGPGMPVGAPPPAVVPGAVHEVREFPRAEGNLPQAWVETPFTRLPHHVARAEWSRIFYPREQPTLRWDGAFLGSAPLPPGEPHRVEVEVPPGESLRVELDCAWDAPLHLAVGEGKTPMSGFGGRKQHYRNGASGPRTVSVLIAQSRHQGRGVDAVSNPKGPWPYRIRLERSWDPGRWRSHAEPHPWPEGLPLRAPDELRVLHALPFPTLADAGLQLEDPGLGTRTAEVELILDGEGRPRAVRPVAGSPALVRPLVDWAWQLAFAPGVGFPSEGARVPLRLVYLRPEGREEP